MTKIKHTVQRFDSDSYRIYLGGTIIAIATRYSNGTWKAHDRDDRVMPGIGAHATPKAVAKAMDAAASR